MLQVIEDLDDKKKVAMKDTWHKVREGAALYAHAMEQLLTGRTPHQCHCYGNNKGCHFQQP